MQEVMSELRLLGVGCAGRPARFVIQGGYFETVRGLDGFALNSLERAFDLGAALATSSPGNQVHYDLLVNDLGSDCSGDVCAMAEPAAEGRDVAQLSQPAIEMARSRGIGLGVSTERHMRNRGFRHLKKIFRSPGWQQRFPGLHSQELGERRQWTLHSRSLNDIVLFEEQGPSWIAKCPIIMGSYYACMLDRAGDDDCETSKVVIDLCAPADRDKVCKGAEAAFALFRPGARRQDLVMPVLCDPACMSMIPVSLMAMDFA